MRNCCLWASDPQWETHSFVALLLSLNTFLSLIYGLILELRHWQFSTHISTPCKLALPQEWRRQIQRQTSDCFRLPWQELSDIGGAWVVFVENNLRSYFSISLIRTLGAGGGLADTSSWSPSSSLNNAATPRPLGCTLVTLSHIAHLFYTRPMLNKTNGKLRSIS